MAAPIPTQEPAQIVAGDSAQWTISEPNYSPGDGWTLTYSLVPETGFGGVPITITGSSSGNLHSVTVLNTDSVAWQPGIYAVQGYVSKAGQRVTVRRGTITILPNFASGTAIDTRSTAKRILDFIDSSFAKLTAKQTVRATIEGVDLQFRNLEELMKARNYWASIVAQEDAALSGKGRNAVLAVFTKPGSQVPWGFPWNAL